MVGLSWKLTNRFPEASVIVSGHLKARTGQKDDALYTHFHESPPELDAAHHIPTRHPKKGGAIMQDYVFYK